MKQTISLLIGILIVNILIAQNDSTKVKVLNKNVVTVVEDNKGTQVKVGNDRGIEVITDDRGDTTKIRIGSKVFNVIEGEKRTHINITKDEEKSKRKYGSFNGHWAGLELGMNMFYDTDYSLYEGKNYGEFMDLITGKSIAVNLNFWETAFKNKRQNFGLVTGMGLNFMDYTFDQDLTIKKDADGLIIPDFNIENPKKSKLNVSYLTVPLMLELKTSLKQGGKNLYLAGGVIGGLNIGSHTKIKYNKDKEKERRNFNINPFKYELTGRIGFGDFCIFANYSMTSLFRDGKGPELYPLTIGISFPNI